MLSMMLVDIVLCVCAPRASLHRPMLGSKVKYLHQAERPVCRARNNLHYRARPIKNILTAQMQLQQQQSCQGTGCAPV